MFVLKMDVELQLTHPCLIHVVTYWDDLLTLLYWYLCTAIITVQVEWWSAEKKTFNLSLVSAGTVLNIWSLFWS